MADISHQGCLRVSAPPPPQLHPQSAGPKQSLKEYRYVGNKMAAFVMQTMGCDVATLNTVQFSMQTQAIDPRSPSLGSSLAVSLLLNTFQAITPVTSSSKAPRHLQKKYPTSTLGSRKATLPTSMSCLRAMPPALKPLMQSAPSPGT